MSPPDGVQGGISYRVQQLEQTNRQLVNKIDEQSRLLVRLEPLPGEVKSLRGAAYKVGGMIVAAAIGFAISVLTVFS